MNARSQSWHAQQAALRNEMEATRIDLLATNVAIRLRDLRSQPSGTALTPANVGRALSASPSLTFLAPLLLALLMLGPTRVVPLMLRTGLRAWLTRTVRSLVGG